MTTETTTDADECPEAPMCTRPKGHSGPHGLEVAPGLVIAPFEGTSNGAPAEETQLPCKSSSCTAQMRMERSTDGGATFTCPRPDCQQVVRLRPDGSYTEILRDLYPPVSAMNNSMKRRYAAHWVATERWVVDALLLCGARTFAQARDRYTEIVAAQERFLAKEGLAPPAAKSPMAEGVASTKPRWAFWR